MYFNNFDQKRFNSNLKDINKFNRFKLKNDKNKISYKLKLNSYWFIFNSKNNLLPQISINKWRFKKIKLNFLRKKKRVRNFYEQLSNLPLTAIYPEKFDAICFILSKFFNKKVELNLIKVHYPYSNNNILVNFLALIINKVKIFPLIRKLFKNTLFKNRSNFNLSNDNIIISRIFPAFLSGMTVKIGGRLLKQKIRPRKTVTKFKKGINAKGKVNYIDFARFNGKNKRGAFSLSIQSSQNYFNKF